MVSFILNPVLNWFGIYDLLIVPRESRLLDLDQKRKTSHDETKEKAEEKDPISFRSGRDEPRADIIDFRHRSN